MNRLRLKLGQSQGACDAEFDDEASDSPILNSHNCSRRPLFIVKDLVLAAFGLLGFVSFIKLLTLFPTNSPASEIGESIGGQTSVPMSCDCGSSVAEAMSLGCKYDSLAAAWLPEHCRDDELTAEFERSGPGVDGKWTYWADFAHTQEISLDEIAAMGGDVDSKFYMSGYWHVIHCIFYWRKEHRARLNGKIVEPRSDSEAHIIHCGKMFLDPGNNTVAGVALNTDMKELE